MFSSPFVTAAAAAPCSDNLVPLPCPASPRPQSAVAKLVQEDDMYLVLLDRIAAARKAGQWNTLWVPGTDSSITQALRLFDMLEAKHANGSDALMLSWVVGALEISWLPRKGDLLMVPHRGPALVLADATRYAFPSSAATAFVVKLMYVDGVCVNVTLGRSFPCATDRLQSRPMVNVVEFMQRMHHNPALLDVESPLLLDVAQVTDVAVVEVVEVVAPVATPATQTTPAAAEVVATATTVSSPNAAPTDWVNVMCSSSSPRSSSSPFDADLPPLEDATALPALPALPELPAAPEASFASTSGGCVLSAFMPNHYAADGVAPAEPVADNDPAVTVVTNGDASTDASTDALTDASTDAMTCVDLLPSATASTTASIDQGVSAACEPHSPEAPTPVAVCKTIGEVMSTLDNQQGDNKRVWIWNKDAKQWEHKEVKMQFQVPPRNKNNNAVEGDLYLMLRPVDATAATLALTMRQFTQDEVNHVAFGATAPMAQPA